MNRLLFSDLCWSCARTLNDRYQGLLDLSFKRLQWVGSAHSSHRNQSCTDGLARKAGKDPISARLVVMPGRLFRPSSRRRDHLTIEWPLTGSLERGQPAKSGRPEVSKNNHRALCRMSRGGNMEPHLA